MTEAADVERVVRASGVECQDCGDGARRRSRCANCSFLVCRWCLHHVHSMPHNAAAGKAARAMKAAKP